MRGRVAFVLSVSVAALALSCTPAVAGCANPDLPETCVTEEGLPVSALRAVVSAHHGSSYKRPGYSAVKLVSTPEAAYETFTEARTGVHLQWLTAERESNVVTVPWSCRHPRQAFHDTLTARGNVGATVTTEVTFHAPLSAQWCAAARGREEAQRAAAKRRHEAERRETERRETTEREARQRSEHETASTCTNGTYVNSAGNTVCKPEESSTGPPAGATAECEDGTYSFSESHSGTCSSHGGVVRWL